jgi:carboxyl-terminal processing protease
MHRRLLVCLLILLLVAACQTTQVRTTHQNYLTTLSAEEGGDKKLENSLKIFTEVLEIIRKNYIEDLESKDFIYGAIKGGIKTIDPNSSFLTPEKYKEMQVDTKREFGVIGVQIGIKKGKMTVIAPFEDAPAYKAGLKSDDKIIKINEESTEDMTLSNAVEKLRGLPRTTVTLTIFRKGWLETKDFIITREIFNIKSVKAKSLENKIGYVKITQFNFDTAIDLSNAMEKLMQEKIKALILDLRNNPGGLLNSGVDVASQFLSPNKLVVYLKDRKNERIDYQAGEGPKYTIPMIVLVNQGSAGSSEIVAGALKDWHRAFILGTKTFGKGTVQSVIPLSDGSALRLTTARYYTPKDVSIEALGIMPDIIVEPEEKEDVQLQRAIDLLQAWEDKKKLDSSIERMPATDG